jgi:putative Holliday junction resolvase
MPEGSSAAGDGIVLGFDFGLRRIGVALGNGVTRSASGLKVVQRRSAQRADHWAELAALIAQWQPHQLVVGVARHPDGVGHQMTERCERFARQLEGRFGLPVARVDERYSSAVLAPGAATDDQAAAVILQQWFDEHSEDGRSEDGRSEDGHGAAGAAC